jgi:hypothetical protein
VELRLGAVEQHVNVAAGDAERRGHVFSALFFEEAERDDRFLGVAQAIHTGAQANVLFGADHECFRRGIVRRVLESVDGRVRSRQMMEAALVPRSVAHDSAEKARDGSRHLGQLTVLAHSEKGAERIVDAVNRVFGTKPLSSGDARELDPFGSDELGQHGVRIGLDG